MAKLDDVQQALEVLNSEFRRPGIIEDLSLSAEFIIPDDYKDKSFPNSDSPGVYLFFNGSDELLYIGKASEGLGKRIGGGYIGRDGKIKEEKISEAIKLRTIAVPWEHYFEAPAIEEFLIGRLNPPINSVGKNH